MDQGLETAAQPAHGLGQTLVMPLSQGKHAAKRKIVPRLPKSHPDAEKRLAEHFRQFLHSKREAIINQAVQLYTQALRTKLAKSPAKTILVDFDGVVCAQIGHLDDPAFVDGAPIAGAF
jgi:hypothetical protein